jgi:ribosome-associated heat shock protein Hsp15
MSEGRIRLDRWLWVARFARSRALAQELCQSGHVRLNGNRVKKPGREIHPGDQITLPAGREILLLRIIADAPRRGPAEEARRLYEIVKD